MSHESSNDVLCPNPESVTLTAIKTPATHPSLEHIPLANISGPNSNSRDLQSPPHLTVSFFAGSIEHEIDPDTIVAVLETQEILLPSSVQADTAKTPFRALTNPIVILPHNTGPVISGSSSLASDVAQTNVELPFALQTQTPPNSLIWQPASVTDSQLESPTAATAHSSLVVPPPTSGLCDRNPHLLMADRTSAGTALRADTHSSLRLPFNTAMTLPDDSRQTDQSASFSSSATDSLSYILFYTELPTEVSTRTSGMHLRRILPTLTVTIPLRIHLHMPQPFNPAVTRTQSNIPLSTLLPLRLMVPHSLTTTLTQLLLNSEFQSPKTFSGKDIRRLPAYLTRLIFLRDNE